MSTSVQPAQPVRSQTTARGVWRQILRITLGALLLYVGFRHLPTGTNLSHMDFRAGQSSFEFCDPANPQFMPVTTVRAPVDMTLRSAAPLQAGREARVRLTLKTLTGKPISAEDLLVVHTQKLHLLIADPTLRDYQHVHPVAEAEKGDWSFVFTPQLPGTYRIFADFTPMATGRPAFANADVAVVANPAVVPVDQARLGRAPVENGVCDTDDYRFALVPSATPIRAGQAVELRFAVSRHDGGLVPLRPIMDAFAHLVAFDEARSGFAHLHPLATDLSSAPDLKHPVLRFKLTLPSAGRYVIWSQVNLGGQEMAVPFGFEVIR